MEESLLTKIVGIISSDIKIVEGRKKFSDALGIPSADTLQLLNSFKMNAITSYELIHDILTKWVSINGDLATIPELNRILKENQWNFCAGKLQKIAEINAAPIKYQPVNHEMDEPSEAENTPRAHSSRTIEAMETSIELFGFGNVVSNFTGRKQELLKLKNFFTSSKSVVLLTGLGGVGKTQLAAKFALSTLKQNFPTTNIVKTWLSGENPQSLLKSIAKFCKRIKICTMDKHQNPLKLDKLLKKILKRLHPSKWLVVIDNVDDMYDEFKEVAIELGKAKRQAFLLITSRNRGIFSGELEHLPLPPLAIQESIEFVKKSLGLHDSSADNSVYNLCRQLGNLPLALDQAIAYIKEQKTLSLKEEDYEVSDYLDELAKEETTGLDKDRELAEYPEATIKVWNMTFDKIKHSYGENGKMAAKVLDIMAFLTSDNIPKSRVQKIYKSLHNKELTKSDLEKILKLLLKYSLVTVRTYNRGSMFSLFLPGGISIHRLVQLALRLRMPNKGRDFLLQFWILFDPKIWGFPTQGVTIFSNECDDSDDISSIWNHSSRFPEFDRKRADLVPVVYKPIREETEFMKECFKLLSKVYGEYSMEYLLMERRVASDTQCFYKLIEKLEFIHNKFIEHWGEDNEETKNTAELLENVRIECKECEEYDSLIEVALAYRANNK